MMLVLDNKNSLLLLISKYELMSELCPVIHLSEQTTILKATLTTQSSSMVFAYRVRKNRRCSIKPYPFLFAISRQK